MGAWMGVAAKQPPQGPGTVGCELVGAEQEATGETATQRGPTGLNGSVDVPLQASPGSTLCLAWMGPSS